MAAGQVFTQLAQRDMHLSRGAGPPDEGGVTQVSEYCKELLMRGHEEMSLEELRAERYFHQRQRDAEERLSRLTQVKEQLSEELVAKTKLLQLLTSQQQSRDSGQPPTPASVHMYDQSHTAAAAWHAGNSGLKDNGFLCPEEGRATEDPQTPVDSCPPSTTTKTLSPIQETSVDAGTCSPLQDIQDQYEMDQTSTAGPAEGAVNPCDPEVRRQLLDLCDITATPGFHSESRTLPDISSYVQLGDQLYHIVSTFVDGGSFSIYEAMSEEQHVLIKVDSCRLPWDFHQFHRLKTSWTTAGASLPQISCFLFLDGCITVYTAPPDHMFIELTECEDSACHKAALLLQLVLQLHSCRLLHAALQPRLLSCSYSGMMNLECIFPVDWSSSVDLDLQQCVTSVQQLPSAHNYISLGLLEPTSPPQLLDLVGVAESVHLLLTNSRMVLLKDDDGWTAEHFSRDEPCDMSPRTWTMWRTCVRLLLNAADLSSLSVLLRVKEQLLSI